MSVSLARRNTFPLVTVGIATYNRDAYLAEAIDSVLSQEGFDDFELIVVEDGTTNPAVREVVASFADRRLRVVRHERNEGISAAYNTIVAAARGELIGMLGDDDLAMPDRLARQVALFKRFPATGVVYGDAAIIDAAGAVVGLWKTFDLPQGALLRTLALKHNFIPDPTRLVHRRVYAAVGGYDRRYRIAQDLHFWLRAARRFPFRKTPGGPVTALRRHGDNLSDESNRDREVAEVERAVAELLRCAELRELVPDLDWDVLPPALARRKALQVVAQALGRRDPPLPRLAARLAASARRPPPRRPPATGPRVLFTGYGFNESGGGTLLPRLIAKGLAARGLTVGFFSAAATPYDPSAPAYQLREGEEDGVLLWAVANRPHVLFDPRNPLRELEDPPITAHFRKVLERFRPDVIHCHNLHNLGGGLLAEAAAHGVPALFTPHNHWLICPSGYLRRPDGSVCAGPAGGSRCAACVGGVREDHEARFAGLRALVDEVVAAVLAPSASLRRTLIAAGYPAERIDVVPQTVPHLERLWRRLGRSRRRLGRGERLRVGFIGSLYPHKGPELLVEAAQLVQQPLVVRLHGEAPPAYLERLLALDRRGVVEHCGPYSPAELERVLADLDVVVVPSQVIEAAGLVVAEAHAAGLPVVAARLGGLLDGVAEERDGLLFAPGQAEELAGALGRLAGEESLLERLAAGIAPPPSFDRFLDALISYYRDPSPRGVGGAEELPTIALRGDHGRNTSLSLINGRLAGGLAGQVKRVDAAGRELDPPLPRGADLEIRHHWPPSFEPPPLGRLVTILPWEFGALPRLWLEEIERNVDLVVVPSEYVAAMFAAAGVAQERLAVVPNGVDLELFAPEGERLALPLGEGVVRFLFVGGLIERKGADLLFEVFTETFAGRADVALVVKGAAGQAIYSEPVRDRYLAWAREGRLPRIVLIEEELPARRLAALYRSCDLLVHPYRGEGFALPVLEALASGLPVIVTAGGPTDEFVPEQACWRIGAERVELPGETVGGLSTKGRPWWLEPDRDQLAQALHGALDRAARAARAAAARPAAARLSWPAVLQRYNQLFASLLARPQRWRGVAPPPRYDTRLRVLATPAWFGEDRLGELLREWAAATNPGSEAVLLLLADPAHAPSPQELEGRLVGCGIDFERCADVAVLREPFAARRNRLLLAGCDLYIPLHRADAPLAALARELGKTVVEAGEGRVAGAVAEGLKFDVAGRFAGRANV